MRSAEDYQPTFPFILPVTGTNTWRSGPDWWWGFSWLLVIDWEMSTFEKPADPESHVMF